MASILVMGFGEIDATLGALVGGKGANLGELSRLDGVQVPLGFCVTTEAFRRFRAGDGEVPGDVAGAITAALAELGTDTPVAVRSSSTAEDLPAASFAGQHDSFLDVTGPSAVIDHVRRCWASIDTERAVAYRASQGIDDRQVEMAVVVQVLVPADAAGVLFTADPLTSNRTVTVVEAVRGLGDALVSGAVDPERYQVRGDEIVERSIAGSATVLTDDQVRGLAVLGRRIEGHFGSPQDIEWCLVGDEFHVVQTRPITTLYPIPVLDDGANHVYLSVGHQQMMTDAMKPLGISVWQMTAMPVMHEAGGRLWVDAADRLTTPSGRAALLGMLRQVEPLFGDALQTVLDRADFIPLLPEDGPAGSAGPPAGLSTRGPFEPPPADPAIVAELIAVRDASNADLARAIEATSGADRLAFIRSDIAELKRLLFEPASHRTYMSAMDASVWLNEHLEAWLGEKNAADTFTLSVPNNVTSEMGLALLDVADAIRPLPEVVAFLERIEAAPPTDAAFLGDLLDLAGGAEAHVAVTGFLDRYGMRCVGEIDITRPRWGEQPAALVPVILGNVRTFEPGEAARRFEQGRRTAEAKEVEVLERLRLLPDGDQKAAETKAKIDQVRTFIGYREHPKYFLISRHSIYRRALLEEAGRLVRPGVLRDVDDASFLTFGELEDALRTGSVDLGLVEERKAAFRWHETLTPPRVLTSDGEAISGSYHRDDAPDGALVGLAVSGGIVEGRARVITAMGQAEIEPGDILVTAFTDPSWSPLFVSVAALVTEVGGLMTHGAVVAREYGLPAVVGVQHATTRIRDGQQIRVHGTDGYVELLD